MRLRIRPCSRSIRATATRKETATHRTTNSGPMPYLMATRVNRATVATSTQTRRSGIAAPFWTELGLSRTLLGESGLLASFFNSLLAGMGAFLLFLIITLAFPRGMGGGDVKLAGLLGLLVGYPGVLVTLWIAVVSGGGVAVSLILLRKKSRKDAMPFGPFLALGAIAALLAGSDIVSRYRDVTAQVWNLWV